MSLAHGCLHPDDKRVATQSTFEHISDVETATTGVVPKHPGDPPFDQGAQYLSSAYTSTLTRHGIEISLAHRGCPWENGYAERLIRTLKEEEVHLNDYEDITEARTHRSFYQTSV